MRSSVVRFSSALSSLLAIHLARASSDHTFVFSIDLLEGRSGYYRVEGYDDVQPELTMVRGQTYVFDQTNSSNWFHPLGFAYYPDGAHEGVDELEEGVGNGDAPVYVINGELSDLDTYEPQFFFPEDTWMESQYTVNLTVTDEDVTEIFYFCHIHNFMSGRIYIVDAEGDEPEESSIDLYDPLERSDFDVECGTFESDPYAPVEGECADPDVRSPGLSDGRGNGTFDSDLCPDQKFVCGDPDDVFDVCMHAIDCKMNYEMRIERETDDSSTVTFMQQMIPHHENAVNMARILLKNPGDEGLDDEVSALVRDIINTQNAQITFMQSFLNEQGKSVDGELCENDDSDDVPVYAIGIMAVLGVFCCALLSFIIFKRCSRSSGDQGYLDGHKVKAASVQARSAKANHA